MTDLYVAVLGDNLLDLPVDVCIVTICKVGVGCQLLQCGQGSLPTAAAAAAQQQMQQMQQLNHTTTASCEPTCETLWQVCAALAASAAQVMHVS